MKQLSSKIVYKNKWMRVREDTIEYKNGSRGIYGVVDKPHFSLIVPYDGSNFYLIRQYRYAVGKSYWEFPQGSYEINPKIDPKTVALRELEEEAGLKSAKISQIGFFYEAYGFSNQGFYIFLAENLTVVSQKTEESEEDVQVKKVSVKEFEEMIIKGDIKDAPSISAYTLFSIKNKLP